MKKVITGKVEIVTGKVLGVSKVSETASLVVKNAKSNVEIQPTGILLNGVDIDLSGAPVAVKYIDDADALLQGELDAANLRIDELETKADGVDAELVIINNRLDALEAP